ncbi:hypothetical protein E9998_14040 [Glycomyces paridis]|uniref:DUF1963 domain-containing protein n=1 Tax=Glycomyces paridis TaxID=2126555 RepID=A0A4S8PHA2_9ACTN|nr:hypothetical protein E9998_14040 [Glycomyces paridis]
MHPREGTPTARASSIGGPLLWPAAEPWPTCTEQHDDSESEPIEYVVALRTYYADRDARMAAKEAIDWDVERLIPDRIKAAHPLQPGFDPAAPSPLIAYAQLHYAEVPGLPWPERFDLLQVLWCPRDHPDIDSPYSPAFQLRWRRMEGLGDLAAEPPLPAVCFEDYLPNQCTLAPEAVTEYPQLEDLPQALASRIRAVEDDEGADMYGWDFARAPGNKAVGHGGTWGIIDPFPVLCECGAEQLPLLTVDSGESDGGDGSWRPIEDAGRDRRFQNPTGITVGRSNKLQLYYCPESENHTNRTVMF